MGVKLHIEKDEVRGQLWLRLEPGTTVRARERLLDEHLGNALFEASAKMGVVLSAEPCAYAYLTDQVNDEKQTCFLVQARAEGDRLVPVHGHRRKRE
jgi:hypothetical protein